MVMELTSSDLGLSQFQPAGDYNFQLGVDGFSYGDLYKPARLQELAETFYAEIDSEDESLGQDYARYREGRGEGFSDKAESDLIVRLAPYLSRFVARLFDIGEERERLESATLSEQVIFNFKKNFVHRRSLRKFTADALADWDFQQLDAAVSALKQSAFPEAAKSDEELSAARMVVSLTALEKEYEQHLGPKKLPLNPETRQSVSGIRTAISKAAALAEYVITDSTLSQEEQEQRFITALVGLFEKWVFALPRTAPERVKSWVSYHEPHSVDYHNLVQLERPKADLPEFIKGPDSKLRRRDGFNLTDPRYNKREVLDEIDYCLYCHERDKDSCSKGLTEKDGSFKENPLGITLAGCPLDEKISEMHLLKKRGDSIAALAAIMIDNPMCPGTGHRICNDCMKSCIFQKQDPVNIPQAETGIVTDVLELPYGFEIFSLLTRWNPLNVKRPFALPYNGKKILIVGMGPAGYTLAQFLLNEGFGVIGIDGLKIEPLPSELVGDELTLPKPIKQISEICTDLSQRIMAGFGGVSEYGITVRWDKNFLRMIHLALSRRDKLRVFGGVRFGGTMTIEDAWQVGFDHIAIATGAGKPTIVEMKNNLIRGIRKASDFLMALQLTGAAKRTAMANLQAQLPAIVIGGGLTAIDTATELTAYYPLQVEKALDRFEKLAARYGEEAVLSRYDDEERQIFDRFLEHGRMVRKERERARMENRLPDFVPLVRGWGGVTIVYRKGLADAPAYRLNHEEIIKSFEEGIYFIEQMSPVEAHRDQFGAVAELTFERMKKNENGKWRSTGEQLTLPAKTVCVAAGTSPNIIYEREKPGTFRLDKWNEFFAGFKIERNGGSEFHLSEAAAGEPAFFTSYEKDGRFISYYGDNHPVYAGNVVKAMASAKQGYTEVVKLFEAEITDLDPAGQPDREEEFQTLAENLEDSLMPRVVRVERLTSTIVDVIVRAPFAAERFHPGQFYRLQNYEVNSKEIAGTKLTMEGIALTGAWVNKEDGLLSLIVLEMGGSSRLCATLRPGERVIVMGPTGAPTEIPSGETVLLAGGGLGNAVLFSIGKALRENGNKVIYFAGYKKGEDLYKQTEVEESADQVIWSTDAGAEIPPRRPQDAHIRANIVQAMKAYADGELGERLFNFKDVDRVVAIGSDRMMAAVKAARRCDGVLGACFRPDHIAIGSINSPMQCMMKEVCAQCLQKHVDPVSGEETKPVFSCFNQDQKLDEVDFKNLNERLRANTVQEKLANLWLDYLLELEPVEMV